MTRCLSRATVITVRLDMKAATQGTVLTSLDTNIRFQTSSHIEIEIFLFLHFVFNGNIKSITCRIFGHERREMFC